MLRKNDCCEDVVQIQVLTPDSIHYAKIACKNCGKFWKWLPDPKHTIAHEQRKIIIDTMLPHYSDKEKIVKFLSDIRDNRHLSPAQHRYFMNLKDQMPVENLIDL